MRENGNIKSQRLKYRPIITVNKSLPAQSEEFYGMAISMKRRCARNPTNTHLTVIMFGHVFGLMWIQQRVKSSEFSREHKLNVLQ